MAGFVAVCDTQPAANEECAAWVWVPTDSLSGWSLTVEEGAAIGGAVLLALAGVWGVRYIGRVLSQS